MNILCIASHPDDEVLGVGGTLLRHKAQGDDVTVVLTHECRPRSTLESQQAEGAMGVDYIRWPDDLERIVADLAPDIVYTHSLADLHIDHVALHERVLVACRPYSAPSIKALYTFETPSATDWGMVPFIARRFVDITDYLEQKLDVMAAYESELREPPHPRSIAMLEVRAAFWGQHAGYRWAEAFDVVRERW